MKILFLCSSNIFRSQMAEKFFNEISKELNLNFSAKSAALIKPQDKMHSLIIRAMREKNLDISENESKSVNQEMLKEADIIIVMHPKLERLARQIIQENKKIIVWNIQDVIASETEEEKYPEFLKTRDVIEEKVKQLLKTLNTIN